MTTTNDNPLNGASEEEQARLLAAIATGEKTWAETVGLTRSEAYGLAKSAESLLDVGQVDKATTIFEGLVTLNPLDAYFHSMLGALKGRKGDEDGALESYTRAIELDEAHLAALVNRAELYLGRGDIEPALGDLVKATKADPQGSTPIGKRALVLARATRDALHAALDGK